MKLHLLTLKFAGNSSPYEALFQNEYNRISLPHIRISLGLGILFYAAFGFLDALLIPEQKTALWFIRFIIVCPVLITTLLVSFSKQFERYMQPLLAADVMLGGGGIIGMIIIAPPPFNQYYYAGLLLVFMWGYTFIRLRFLWASLAGWVQILLYEIAAIWISPMPVPVLISNNSFFISANVIGMLACYSIEYYARRDYFLTQQLEMEREKIGGVNQALEEQVEKRTVDYQIVNRALEQEIIEHKRAEERLQLQEERLRLALASAQQGWFDVDIASGAVMVSPEYARMIGYEPSEFQTSVQGWIDSIHLEDREGVLQAFHDCLKTGKTNSMEYRRRKKTGEWLWIRSIGKVVEFDSEHRPLRMTGTHADISTRKQVEEALRESEEKYRLLAENVTDVIWTLSLESMRFTYISPSVLQMRGYTPEEAMELTLEQTLSPESLDRAIKILQEEQAMETMKDVAKKRFRSMELQALRKDGTYAWVEVTASFVRNAEDRIIKILGVTRDIAERKREGEEKKSLEERLHRVEKMESIGTLAGGVAHDLNNMLGALIGYAELLKEDLKKTDPRYNMAEGIMASAEKAAAVVQDLLTMARRGVVLREPANLNRILADQLNSSEIRRLLISHPSVTIKTDYDRNLPDINVSAIHIERALTNLISNALHAIGDDGIIIIKTEYRPLEHTLMGYEAVPKGEYAVLLVSDSGVGISPEHLPYLFEPFYMRKVLKKGGSGLGFSVIWGALKDHDGYIDVTTALDRGTTFSLYFPVTFDDIVRSVEHSVEEYLGNRETVLVVDDEEDQCRVAEMMLTRLNYVVTTVESGEKALGYLADHDVDLVVLDMIMESGMDGYETYRKIVEMKKQQKAIIFSGFTKTERVKMAQELGAGEFIMKPYVRERLGIAVRKELDRK